MALIRIPKEAEPLLIYCRPNANRLSNTCFETYAEFMIFAACFGFYKTGVDGNEPVSQFIDQPYPIDMTIFKNQNLYPQILLLGLVLTHSHDITKQEEMLARVIENFAAKGCHELTKLLKKTIPESFHLELSELIREAVP
jgi:hypothetical protein